MRSRTLKKLALTDLGTRTLIANVAIVSSARCSMDQVADPIVVVRRQWNDWRCAEVRFSSLSNFKWMDRSGGVGARGPQPFIYAGMSCDAIVSGAVGHSCRHGPAPHWIRVCVLKKDNDPDVFARVLSLAGPKPSRPPLKR